MTDDELWTVYTDAGSVYLSGRPTRFIDQEEMEREQIQAVAAAVRAEQATALGAATAEVERQADRIRDLESAIDWTYPTIAGRVIQLQQAGEVQAAAHWNDVARRLYVARGGYVESIIPATGGV